MSLIIRSDLRPSFGRIRNQGSRPTCVAFAVSDAHAVARGSFSALSVEHLYYYAVQRTPGGHPDDGVNLPTTLLALRQDGQAAEAGWPYVSQLPVNLASWKPPASASPVFKRRSVSAAAAIAAITSHLATGVPVVLTLLISDAFCAAQNGMILQIVNDVDVDWHAVVAVGHGRDGIRQLVLIRNSWGPTWGIRGYGWVDVDYLAQRLGQLATMSP